MVKYIFLDSLFAFSSRADLEPINAVHIPCRFIPYLLISRLILPFFFWNPACDFCRNLWLSLVVVWQSFLIRLFLPRASGTLKAC